MGLKSCTGNLCAHVCKVCKLVCPFCCNLFFRATLYSLKKHEPRPSFIFSYARIAEWSTVGSLTDQYTSHMYCTVSTYSPQCTVCCVLITAVLLVLSPCVLCNFNHWWSNLKPSPEVWKHPPMLDTIFSRDSRCIHLCFCSSYLQKVKYSLGHYVFFSGRTVL